MSNTPDGERSRLKGIVRIARHLLNRPRNWKYTNDEVNTSERGDRRYTLTGALCQAAEVIYPRGRVRILRMAEDRLVYPRGASTPKFFILDSFNDNPETKHKDILKFLEDLQESL